MMRTTLSAAFMAMTFALPAAADDVSVFAAASLKNALDEIASDFTVKTGDAVTISYAGSNALARQIIEGAPADVFISANVEWADQVEQAGLIADRKDLLGNTLVLIAHGRDAAPVNLTGETDLRALLNGGKLAMALVDSVPAGQYGKAALQDLGLWDSVQADVAQSDNVRAALSLVSTGEAPYGIVYSTDAAAGDDVSVVAEFPRESYPEITYPAAILRNAVGDADRAFFDALSGPEADAIFAKHGFVIKN